MRVVDTNSYGADLKGVLRFTLFIRRVPDHVVQGTSFKARRSEARLQRHPYSYADADGNGVLGYNEVTVRNSWEQVGRSASTLAMALHSELQLAERLTLGAILDRRSGAWAQSAYVSTLCALPEASCRAYQDPASSLEEQARAYASYSAISKSRVVTLRSDASAVPLPRRFNVGSSSTTDHNTDG